MQSIQQIIHAQREYFLAGHTRSLAHRLQALDRLQLALRREESAILEALHTDLNKAPFEAYATELGIVHGVINDLRRHLPKWVKPKRCPTPIVHFPSTSYRYYDPYGVVLVMAPWNYPLQLTLVPLISAIAAGNCVVVKPSNYSVATSKVLASILREVFDPAFVAVVEGGRAENQALLEQQFDYIFFTGSPQVGKLVMEQAAKHVTPLTLELGGKSPCIVDKTANIPLAAKRIAWGKLLNAGQTCVAPDYLLVHCDVKDAFVAALKDAIEGLYGATPEHNAQYPKIINEAHFARLTALLDGCEQRWGGRKNEETRQLSPAIVEGCDWHCDLMGEELFGPIFPVIAYDDLTETLDIINRRPRPLALYCFTEDKAVERQVLTTALYGGGCINDAIIHLANEHLPFGGVGTSGLGSYHGRESFETFTHTKGVLRHATWLDIPLRYPPYRLPLWLLKKFQG